MKSPLKESKFLPLKILQNNERVAEVQFVCDSCGKQVKTSLIPRKDLDALKSKIVTCWQCKQVNSAGKKS
jgi:hypothetical protein